MPYWGKTFRVIIFQSHKIIILPDGDNKLELSAFSVEEKGDLKLGYFMHKFVGV